MANGLPLGPVLGEDTPTEASREVTDATTTETKDAPTASTRRARVAAGNAVEAAAAAASVLVGLLGPRRP